MNREILFRGKRIDIGMWEYGNLSMRDELGKAKYYIGQNMLGYEVLPETVGQFTGLADRNGRKIFEGDIIKWHDEWIDCDFVGVVEFDHCSAAFKVRVGNELIPFSDVDCEYVIKAGNIHDNPGLVGDTENEH